MYAIAIILIFQLFNLQILHGQEYYETSSQRLTREITIKAARGKIIDRNGIVLAGTKIRYSLVIYRSKIDNETLNNSILKAVNLLEEQQEQYKDEFPIDKETEQFIFTTEQEKNDWLLKNELDEYLTETEVLNYYKEKYNISTLDQKDARKIISVRYGIEKYGYSTMRGYIIATNISSQTMMQIEEQNTNFPGMAIEAEPVRAYYYDNLASHILGYVGKVTAVELEQNRGYANTDYIGKTAIENVFEQYLKGEDGAKQIDMSVEGTKTAEYITKEAVQGSDVVLTIDAKIQEAAEKALAARIEGIRNGEFGKKYNAQTGAAVLIDVNTGEILAMCSYPDYEPQLFVEGISVDKWNEYTQEGESALLNRNIQSANAPGSIFKMVSAIAGLETGAITIEEKINDTGIYPKGYNPRCWVYSDKGYGHGMLNVSEAIKHSCNYYFYEVGTRIGIAEIEKYAKNFGLGQKTNVELTGEISGTLAGLELYEKLDETWYYGNTLSAVIGQAENNFTPLQIAKYIAMLTNGGRDIDITIIKNIIKQDGTLVSKENIANTVNEKLGIQETREESLKIKEENLSAVLEGMKSVTTETGGTAYSVFKDFEIEVGGKTGSAEAGNKTNAWFVGFAPYEKPEVAVVVFIENGWHGYYTAGVAKEILEAYFGLNEVIEENRTIETIN